MTEGLIVRWGKVLVNFLLSCFVFFLLGVPRLLADEFPPNWPWRGVNLDNVYIENPSDLKRIVNEIPINSIRLTLFPFQLSKHRETSIQAAWKLSLKWADSVLDICKELGVTCIIGLDEFPFDEKPENYKVTEEFWEDESAKRQILEWSHQMAERFGKRGTELGGYDVMSEPVMMKNGSVGIKPPGWPDLQNDIIKAIRKHDKDHWIIVKPGYSGLVKGYRGYEGISSDKKIVYSVHFYDPHEFTHQGIRHWQIGPTYPGRVGGVMWDKNTLKIKLRPVSDFAQKNSAPIWVGEFGALRWAPGSEEYIRDLAEIFDEEGWGWAYFSFSYWHGWNPDYNDTYFTRGHVGSDEAFYKELERQRTGLSSKRWQTLKTIFGEKPTSETVSAE